MDNKTDPGTRKKATVKPDEIHTRDVSRRSFLRAAGCVAGAATGAALAACELLEPISDLKLADTQDVDTNDRGEWYYRDRDPIAFGGDTIQRRDSDVRVHDAITFDSDSD
ncbi:MAG: twin-arginine translocation signal domain-containing protein [Gammaproteobacteria bacterium]|nr:twin-arginine translocation signal domain-containing protein [Gammaproteobacteria bacterium]